MPATTATDPHRGLAVTAAGDPDPHVPWQRVEQSAAVFAGLGATVDLRRYPGLPHTVNADELGRLDELLTALTDGGP
jgi:predicted esterase